MQSAENVLAGKKADIPKRLRGWDLNPRPLGYEPNGPQIESSICTRFFRFCQPFANNRPIRRADNPVAVEHRFGLVSHPLYDERPRPTRQFQVTGRASAQVVKEHSGGSGFNAGRREGFAEIADSSSAPGLFQFSSKD